MPTPGPPVLGPPAPMADDAEGIAEAWAREWDLLRSRIETVRSAEEALRALRHGLQEDEKRQACLLAQTRACASLWTQMRASADREATLLRERDQAWDEVRRLGQEIQALANSLGAPGSPSPQGSRAGEPPAAPPTERRARTRVTIAPGRVVAGQPDAAQLFQQWILHGLALAGLTGPQVPAAAGGAVVQAALAAPAQEEGADPNLALGRPGEEPRDSTGPTPRQEEDAQRAGPGAAPRRGEEDPRKGLPSEGEEEQQESDEGSESGSAEEEEEDEDSEEPSEEEEESGFPSEESVSPSAEEASEREVEENRKDEENGSAPSGEGERTESAAPSRRSSPGRGS
ncbi:hypothetical protein ACSSS7_008445 [Eimeria intestinalis]